MRSVGLQNSCCSNVTQILPFAAPAPARRSLVLSTNFLTTNAKARVLPCQALRRDLDMSQVLPAHPTLHRGQLRNGMRYVIMPNKFPPNRFEARMQVHVGSIDEDDDQQGMAHMLEHLLSEGSKKTDGLLCAEDALYSAYTTFHRTVYEIESPTTAQQSDEDLLPLVLESLSEIAFRPKILSSHVEIERHIILSELQRDNTIHYRINCELLRHLHSENKLSKRSIIGLAEQIKNWDKDQIMKFHKRWYVPGNATLYIVGDFDNISKVVDQIEAVLGHTGLESEPVAVRPPLRHNWSFPGNNIHQKPPQIFQHNLFNNISFYMCTKIPLRKLQTYGDARNYLMTKLFLSALCFRMRMKISSPPFAAIKVECVQSIDAGCIVTKLIVSCGTINWQSAIKVAVHEVRKLKEFGVTMGELTCYKEAELKQSEHLAAMVDRVSTADKIESIMDNDSKGHAILDDRQLHEILVAVSRTITLEEVNSIGFKLLEFISDYGKPTAPVPAVILACFPTKVHVGGKCEIEFTISAAEINDAIEAGLVEPVVADPKLHVPKRLISSSQLQKLRRERNPSFIPLSSETNVTKFHDMETGITQCRLSNGISVNYKITKTNALIGEMRLIVGGGRVVESLESRGAVIIGVETLIEGGRVGKYSKDQVQLFCENYMIKYSLKCTEEFITMDFSFNLKKNGMRAVFQLLYMLLEHSVWLDDAFCIARGRSLVHYRHSIPKSLERSTIHKVMSTMLDGDETFVAPTPKSLHNLDLQTVKDAVLNQFSGHNMEVSVVGDFSQEDIESCILDYLGTVRAIKNPEMVHSPKPIVFRPVPSGLRSQQVFLKDTAERSCGYIVGLTPNNWGFTIDGKVVFESITTNLTMEDEQPKSETLPTKSMDEDLRNKLKAHPLFFFITIRLLADIIDFRLYSTIRKSLGLTYSVSFDLKLFDRLNFGWYVVFITSTPAKVHEAVVACKNVLRGLDSDKITPWELNEAKEELLANHKEKMMSNSYWLDLMAHLQASSVPRKDISCIKDLVLLYEAVSIDDLYVVYDHLKVDEECLYSCIGIAGPH